MSYVFSGYVLQKRRKEGGRKGERKKGRDGGTEIEKGGEKG